MIIGAGADDRYAMPQGVRCTQRWQTWNRARPYPSTSSTEESAKTLKRAWEEQNKYGERMERLIPQRASFILVDQSCWVAVDVFTAGQAIPFLERDGQYWGPPQDDETAIQELERLRRSGASFMVFGFPSFWMFEYYSGLHTYLREHFPCILENDRLVVFNLRS